MNGSMFKEPHAPRKAGHNRFGEKEPSWRNVWIVPSMENVEQAMDEVIRIMRRRLIVLQDALGRNDQHTLLAMNLLGTAHRSRGNLEEAEKLHCEALARMEKALGAEHPKTLSSMNNLANVLSSQGRLVEAEKLHQKALATREKALGAEHPDTLASMNNLASVLHEQGRLGEAEELHREALARMEKALGAELAKVLKKLGRLVEAEKLHHEALAGRGVSKGRVHASELGRPGTARMARSSRPRIPYGSVLVLGVPTFRFPFPSRPRWPVTPRGGRRQVLHVQGLPQQIGLGW